MYKCPPYHRRYYRYPYYQRYNRYRWSPLYNRYRWTPHYYRYLCDRYYNYQKPYYRKYYFDDLYLDLKTKMNMFKSFLDSLPKSRSEMVNELEVPEDLLRDRPYAGVSVDEELSSIGSVPSVCTLDELKARPRSPLSTDSSLSLSKAITDSEIDYDRFKRFNNRSLSDPLLEVKLALEAFPEEYLVSLNTYQNKASDLPATSARERPLYNEGLTRRMEQFFDEECRVFLPEDPGLLDLEDALQSIDLKTLNLDLL